jgi:hypothetical protein
MRGRDGEPAPHVLDERLEQTASDLREALRALDPVPQRLHAAVVAALASRRDVPLASIVFDSRRDESRSIPDFGDPPGTVVVVCRCRETAIVLRIHRDGGIVLRGTLVPPGSHRVVVRLSTNVAIAVEEEGEEGSDFTLRLGASGPISLELVPRDPGSGGGCVTDWVAV